MRRGIQAGLVLLVAVLLPVFWLFRPPAELPARFALADCDRVALTDTESGRTLVGAEDMALMPDGDTLIVSAHDRLALARRPDAAPEGGLYQVSLTRLAAGQGWATPLVPSSSVEGGLFPHGIAVSGDGARLALVNRGRDGTTSIIAGDLGPGVFTPRHRRGGREVCRANDLDFTGQAPTSLRVTLDRADCGVSWADLRPGATTGRVIALDPAGAAPPSVEADGLAFANGIAGMWVAETRSARLSHLLDRPLSLPGGPDNLTWDETSDGAGGLVAALHPSMLQIAVYIAGYASSAPSRIVRVARDRSVEVLFDDPVGALFSGATVGLLRDGVLVAGSVLDAGVMVCRKAAG